MLGCVSYHKIVDAWLQQAVTTSTRTQQVEGFTLLPSGAGRHKDPVLDLMSSP